jgi:hypothetical protein
MVPAANIEGSSRAEIEGAFMLLVTLAHCRKSGSTDTQFGLSARTARYIRVFLCASSGVATRGFARETDLAQRADAPEIEWIMA